MDSGEWRQLNAQQASRVLYPNPVCFLTTFRVPCGPLEPGPPPPPPDPVSVEDVNAMTITWLTPTNNAGGLVLSMNKGRFSAAGLLAYGVFTLSVAQATQKAMLCRVGKCSGRDVCKFKAIDGLSPCIVARSDGTTVIGSRVREPRVKGPSKAKRQGTACDAQEHAATSQSGPARPASWPPAIEGTVAHLHCRVVRVTDGADDGHHLVVAQVAAGAAHPLYFNGSTLSNGAPTPEAEEREEMLPAVLTFLGSQTFGEIVVDTSPQQLE